MIATQQNHCTSRRAVSFTRGVFGLWMLWLSIAALFYACGDSEPKTPDEPVGVLAVSVEGLPVGAKGAARSQGRKATRAP